MKPRAWLRLRSTPHYRRDAFTCGLERLGYDVVVDGRRIEPCDVLVLWNRHRRDNDLAARFEAANQPVIIAENAYISPSWSKKWFALALNHHLGAGSWRSDGPERWRSFGIKLQPWRGSGKHVLVLCQRGIGEPGVAMSGHWPRDAAGLLKKMTERRLRMRHHPGMARQMRSLEGDLDGAHCCVTWASGAAIKALAAGYPVFYGLRNWVGAGAAVRFLAGCDIEKPRMDDAARLTMFERLAWCQWNVDEIESGEAFAWLLQ